MTSTIVVMGFYIRRTTGTDTLMQSTHADGGADTSATGLDEPTEDENRDATPSVDVPESIDSPRAKLVYLYLATHGAVAEDQLCEGLEMKRITLYSILQTLRGADLVSRDDKRYTLA